MIQKLSSGGLPDVVEAPPVVPAPPVSAPRPAVTEIGPVAGKRVILISVDEPTGRSEYLHDYRALSEVLVDDAGQRIVRVMHESAWYGVGDAQYPAPESGGTPWPAELVWLE